MAAIVSVRLVETLTMVGDHYSRRLRDNIDPWIIKQPERWFGIAERRMDAAYVSACFRARGSDNRRSDLFHNDMADAASASSRETTGKYQRQSPSNFQ